MPGIEFDIKVNEPAKLSEILGGIGDAFGKAFDNDKTLAKFNAGLGQSAETTAKMGDLAKEVWSDGWGESLEDVTGAIGEVGSQMVDLGKTSPDEVKKITKGAMDLAEVMGVDVPEVTRAAGQLMKNGLAVDAQQAFDIIATGAQNGANRSGDLLDVFDEYGPAFAAIGIDGPTALGMLNGALDAGAYNADKAADAINEFGVRILDGSAVAGGAFDALGLDADEMVSKIAAGGPGAQQAFSQIVQALGTMTDPVAQETAGVQLFGTMWEDMGPKAILAMDPVQSKTGELAGATEQMGGKLHDVATEKVETIKRKFDEWVGSMVATNGPFGDIAAFATTFGPQALTLAGNVGMIALALKGTALGAWASTAAMGALSIAAMPIAAIAAAVAGLIGMIANAIDKVDTLKRNLQGIVSGNFTAIGDIGLNIGRPGFGNSIFGHAAGGVVTRPHLAMVGEGGEPEMILPLSKVGDMLAAAGGGNGGGNVYVTVPNGFVGSKDELAGAIRDILAYGQRTGIISAAV